jgi:glycosyltransferase involved in cell wall biosynthesis
MTHGLPSEKNGHDSIHAGFRCRTGISLNIAFVIYGSIDQVSGGYLYDRKVASALRKKNDRVMFVSLKQLPYVFSVLQWCSPLLIRLFRKGVLPQGKKPADCVVVDELVHPSVWFAAVCRGRRGPRFFLLVHHLRSKERRAKLETIFTRVFEKALVNSADAIVVNSRTTARTVEQLLRTPRTVLICPPGKDSFPGGAHYAPEKRKSSPSVIDQKKHRAEKNRPVDLLTVGNLIRRKGYTHLIHSLSRLRFLEWRLTIAGNDCADPTYTRTLKRNIRTLGIEENINITGTVSEKRLASLYALADIFVFPTQYEGYGISLAEAMSFGLPYVAMNSGAVAELIGSDCTPERKEDGGIRQTKGGFLIDPDNAAALCTSLEKLITDAGLRKKLGDESLRMASSLGSWHETGNCFFSALHNPGKHMES